MSDVPGLLLKRAFDHAARMHADQLRKYPGVRIPYISHPATVVATLARHGFSESVQAAAAMHDLIEDTETTFEQLRDRFGEQVATLVRQVSESDKSLPWEERKRLTLEAFATKPWAAQAISLADKIDNLMSLVACAVEHGNPWAQLKRGREIQLARFDALLVLARALPSHPLIDEYARTLELARRVDQDGRFDGVAPS